MKKQMRKLRLSKETVRHMSEQDLERAVGEASFTCAETGMSYCINYASESCLSGASCPSGARLCC
jgi:hypothetical protein